MTLHVTPFNKVITLSALRSHLPIVLMNFSELEHKLKKLGITVTTGSQETIVSVKIGGLVGKKLAQGIQLADRFFEEKVSKILHRISDIDLFVDPAFGPNPSDHNGIVALCDPDQPCPTKGLLQNQANVRSLLKSDKLRWERPKYASPEAVAEYCKHQHRS